MFQETFTLEDLQNKVDALPRYFLSRLPTPLDHMPRLSEELGIDLYIKREDMTGLALGGNKTRELDFFIGEALAQGADVFVAGGGAAQSNHAVQCAAAAKRAGLYPVMVLHRYRYQLQGNVLLNHIMDADIRFVDGNAIDSAINSRTILEEEMRRIAARFESEGRKCFVMPSSFHPLGAVGYVDCAIELLTQLEQRSINADHIYLTSAGATQIGLVLALKALGRKLSVTGINYTIANDTLASRMAELGCITAKLLDIPLRLSAEEIDNVSYAGDGYGIPTQEGMKAMRLAASLEGMFLDPVYSGKGMSGLIDHIKIGKIKKGQRVVFVHTGGVPAIFAYSRELAESL